MKSLTKKRSAKKPTKKKKKTTAKKTPAADKPDPIRRADTHIDPAGDKATQDGEWLSPAEKERADGPRPVVLPGSSPFDQVAHPGGDVPKAELKPNDMGGAPEAGAPLPAAVVPAPLVLAPMISGFLPMIVNRLTPEKPITPSEIAVVEKSIGDMERHYMPTMPEATWLLWAQLIGALSMVTIPRVGVYMERQEAKKKEERHAKKQAKNDTTGTSGSGNAPNISPTF